MEKKQKTNRLINEKSPYLRQHAYNPVDWYPWGEEAFEKARKENKLIFLSIGYSTCHWCHVMAHESFEDDDVARVINKYFVPVKLDREERPDVDAIYMKSSLIMTGGGGWPLNMWLDPDSHLAIYGSTYIPKEPKYNTSGIIPLMEKIEELWRTDKEQVQKSIDSMNEMLKVNANFESEELEEFVATKAFLQLEKNYDDFFGGFSKAPKFPSAHQILFLMQFYEKVGEQKALDMALNTLDSMYRGGIYDHIGGGFSRYSVDKKWLIPHFEKMLYDNALLLYTYTTAYKISKKKRYKDVAYGIYNFLVNEMMDKEKGFYTAQDADSEGEEGLFYKWSYEEIIDCLGPEDGKDFAKLYDVSEQGNFEGGNIPNIIHADFKSIEDEKLFDLKNKLLKKRDERYKLHTDKKIITSTNGLVISAMAYMASVMDDIEPLNTAKNTIEFIEKKMMSDDGKLFLRYIEGDVSYDGVLDDYAFLVWGYLELFNTAEDKSYLDKAKKIMDQMITFFWDDVNGAFYLSSKTKTDLVYRPKEISDGAIPSGNSVAIYNLLRLSQFDGEEKYKKYFKEGVRGSAKVISRSAMHHCHIIESILLNDLK